MNKIKKVLFVCTGNTCRSIMAEALLRKYLQKKGKTNIAVSSAGVMAMDGVSPSYETQRLLANDGVSVHDIHSQRLTDEMVRSSDLILTMQDIHRDEILLSIPEASRKTFALKKYGIKSHKDAMLATDIPDPIGKPPEEYARIFNMIKKEIERIGPLL